MLTVVARLKAAPGHEGDLRPILEACVAPTRAEDGCHTYVLHQGVEQKDLFVFTETWRDKAALDRHMETAHFKRLLADSKPHLAGALDVAMLDRLD